MEILKKKSKNDQISNNAYIEVVLSRIHYMYNKIWNNGQNIMCMDEKYDFWKRILNANVEVMIF